MRLWFSPASEVPIYRQLATQVMLAILSGDLKPGDRLPSTRELARRFSIHPNTVSAGYRELVRRLGGISPRQRRLYEKRGGASRRRSRFWISILCVL